MANGLVSLNPNTPSWMPKPKDTPAKIHDAAIQFESLLIDQMLQTSRGTDGGGWMGSPDDQNSTLMDMGQQQFAQTLARNGGLGIANMIMSGLHQDENRQHQPVAGAIGRPGETGSK